jgi:hypothetical protein
LTILFNAMPAERTMPDLRLEIVVGRIGHRINES